MLYNIEHWQCSGVSHVVVYGTPYYLSDIVWSSRNFLVFMYIFICGWRQAKSWFWRKFEIGLISTTGSGCAAGFPVVGHWNIQLNSISKIRSTPVRSSRNVALDWNCKRGNSEVSRRFNYWRMLIIWWNQPAVSRHIASPEAIRCACSVGARNAIDVGVAVGSRDWWRGKKRAEADVCELKREGYK